MAAGGWGGKYQKDRSGKGRHLLVNNAAGVTPLLFAEAPSTLDYVPDFFPPVPNVGWVAPVNGWSFDLAVTKKRHDSQPADEIKKKGNLLGSMSSAGTMFSTPSNDATQYLNGALSANAIWWAMLPEPVTSQTSPAPELRQHHGFVLAATRGRLRGKQASTSRKDIATP